MIETERHQLALCRLALIRDHWIPISWNAPLTSQHQSSPNEPIITAELIANVRGEQIVGWKKPSFSFAEVGEDGSADVDLKEVAAVLGAGHSDAAAEASGAIGISQRLVERRRKEKVDQIPEQLRKAAFERAAWQIGDRLRGFKATGVTLADAD